MKENKNENIKSSASDFMNPFKGPDANYEIDFIYFYGKDAEKNDLFLNLLTK